MGYKLLISDLDGTLLDNSHQITTENLKAIRKLEKSGMKFVIATGRPIDMIKGYLEILDYDSPLICCNGAALYDAKGKILAIKQIQAEVLRGVIDLIKKCELEYVLYTMAGIVSEKRNERVLYIEKYNKKQKASNKAVIIIDENIYNNLEAYKVVKAFVSASEYSKLHKLRDELNYQFKEVEAVMSQRHILDIVDKHATKGNALLALADYLNIEPKDIAAIGDNYNDVTMLKEAGLAITVENAEDEIRNIADYVSKSNHCSGVAYAIEHFLDLT
ncbi:MAG: Cof-like hydrolase [Clostridia bacterium]|jgi:Cof subfamily protein (haloacid dehalogenase superfamily)|nr:Cof-like hydrolase [Clostridia bacterium]